jgi:hypothetical protein
VKYIRAVAQCVHFDVGNRGILRTSEDINPVTTPRQLAGELTYVYVHPARLLAAQSFQWAGVHTKHANIHEERST